VKVTLGKVELQVQLDTFVGYQLIRFHTSSKIFDFTVTFVT